MDNNVYDKNNIFSKIIKKEAPADIIYEDDNFIVFKDINPMTSVHVLLVPKRSCINLNDLLNENDDYVFKYFHMIKTITRLLNISNNYKIVINNGSKAGQMVMHMHTHIMGF